MFASVRGRLPLLLAALGLSLPAQAQPRDAAVVSTAEPPWPDTAYGQPVPLDAPRPTDDLGQVYGQRAPVAVHLGAGVDPNLVPIALESATRTLDYCQHTLRLEGPWPDGTRGGSPDLDVYLRAEGPWSATPVDAMAVTTRWDRASAFVLARATADHARLRRAVAEGVARAVVLGVKADHPPRALFALGRIIAERALDLPPDREAIRAFQATPGRSLLGGEVLPADELPARGAGLFFDWLLARHDDARHTLLEGLISGPVGYTAPDAPRLVDEPDLLDLLRRLFRDEPMGLRGALAEFNARRALVGSPADETHCPLDNALSAQSHELAWGSLPAWVRPRTALEPTGTSLVTLDLTDAPLDGSLSLWFHGVPWHRWVVRVLRLTARGPLPFLDTEVVRDGEWSTRIESLRGVVRVVVAVTDLGDETLEPDMPQLANGLFVLHAARGR